MALGNSVSCHDTRSLCGSYWEQLGLENRMQYVYHEHGKSWKIQTSLTLPTKLLSSFKKCFQDFENFHALQFQTHVTCPPPGEATAQVQRPASHQTCSQEIIPEKSWSKEPSKTDIDRMIGISVYHDVIRLNLSHDSVASPGRKSCWAKASAPSREPKFWKSWPPPLVEHLARFQNLQGN